MHPNPSTSGTTPPDVSVTIIVIVALRTFLWMLRDG